MVNVTIYIYSIHGSYGLFSVNFQTFPVVCLYSHKWKLVEGRFREWREGMRGSPNCQPSCSFHTHHWWIKKNYPLVMTNSSPWYRWPIEIDGLPNLKMVIFHGYVSHNQMVYTYSKWWSSTSLLLTSCRLCSIFPASKLWVWGFLPENQHGFSTFRSPLSSPIKSAKKPKSRPLRCLGHKRNSSNQPIRYGYLWKIIIFFIGIHIFGSNINLDSIGLDSWPIDYWRVDIHVMRSDNATDRSRCGSCTTDGSRAFGGGKPRKRQVDQASL